MRKRYQRLGEQLRREIIAAAASGATYQQIMDRFGVSAGSVANVITPLGGVFRAQSWERPGSRLSMDDRIEIYLGLRQGWSYQRIGQSLDRPRHRSVICREVKAGGGRQDYRPGPAHKAAVARARRPRLSKLAANPRLRARVVADLNRCWSPQQITAALRRDFGDDPSMQISHEAIYQSVYVQGRGELRRELARCLRSGRAKRKPRSRVERRGRIPDMVMISQRPAEVADRAVPGHWEGDLILGKNSASAIGTLVERSTRFVLLLHLPQGRTAEHVRAAMTATIKTLPEALRRSVTWDQGAEMAQHIQFTVDTGVQVYFCDPHSPWQRGSNENTNGLLRQYFPKGTDLSVHTPADLQAVADSLNTRPRETLGWKTPSERLAELIVATTG